MAGFLNTRTFNGITYREMCRVSNILIKTRVLKTVLANYGQPINKGTARSAYLLGRDCKKRVLDEGLSQELEEVNDEGPDVDGRL
jgi:hypothetical protein